MPSPAARAASRLRAALATTCAAAAIFAGCGRERPAESPEDAFVRLLDACNSGDAANLFDALDTPTQWAIETVHKSQREMRDRILRVYPAAARDAALARLPAACEEDLERPRRYFRRLDDSAATLADLKRRLYLGTGQPVGSVRKKAGIAEVWREGGSIFHFSRDEKGRWAFMELQEQWERAKERALHDLDTVTQNAALYAKQQPAAAAQKGAP